MESGISFKMPTKTNSAYVELKENSPTKIANKQTFDFKEINLQTDSTHKVKWKGEPIYRDKTKMELFNIEPITVSGKSRANHKYLSNSGNARGNRGILKNGSNSGNKQYRPVTVGSSRDADILITPRWESLESQKYNLKLCHLNSINITKVGNNSSDNKVKGSSKVLGDIVQELQLPSVKFEDDEKSSDSKRDWTGVKTALKENVSEKGDAATYFNPLSKKKRTDSESSGSVDIGHHVMTSTPRMSLSDESLEGYKETSEEPWNSKPISRSNSEEFDTDLEIDKDFGRKGKHFLCVCGFSHK